MTAKTTKKKKALTFEAGMQELELLIEKLHTKELPLEESIALYEQGAALHAELEQMLTAQRRRIEMIDPDSAEIDAFEENDNGVS